MSHMMISTRGRYAMRVMIDLASCNDGGFVPMKDVAARQGISLKYLEQILPILTKNKLVETMHGKGGGYRLTRKPEEYTIVEILKLTEGGLEPVACLAPDAEPCEKKAGCKTVEFWAGLNDVINEYLESKTIADFL